MIVLVALAVAGAIVAGVSSIFLQPRVQTRIGLGTLVIAFPVLLGWALVSGNFGLFYGSGVIQIVGFCLTVVGLIRQARRGK